MRLLDPFRESGALLRTLVGHTGAIEAFAISSDGSFIVSAGFNDRTLKIWDVATGQEKATLQGHNANIRLCALSPDDSYIASADEHEKTIMVWDVSSGRERAALTGHTGGVHDLSISPDSRFIVSAGADRTLRIWDAMKAAPRAVLRGHTSDVYHCAISPDGSYIVSSNDDSTLTLWDPKTGREFVSLFSRWPIGKRPFAVSPDSRYVASSRENNTIEIWLAYEAKVTGLLPLPFDIKKLAFHLSQPRLLCATYNNDRVFRIDLIGISLGALVVTASDSGGRLIIQCPACRKRLSLDLRGLGYVFPCPIQNCGVKLRSNRFVLKNRRSRRSSSG